MHIAFRCDSSTAIGTGHLFRCLALAHKARAQRMAVTFVCRPDAGSQHELIRSAGFHLELLKESERDLDGLETRDILAALGQKIDWVICDSYSIGQSWEEIIRDTGSRVLVIDDLADKKHTCDILINTNLLEGMREKYARLTNQDCRLLLGPEYCFIRNAFHEAASIRAERKSRSASQKLNVHVFLGGADLTNETLKILEASIALRERFHFSVILGAANPHQAGIVNTWAKNSHVTVFVAPENYELTLATADLAIGAGGTSMWERFYLGLPTVSVTIADNQTLINQELAKEGYCIYLGKSENVVAEDYLSLLEVLHKCSELRSFLSHRCQGLVDGRGLDRIVAQLLEGAS